MSPRYAERSGSEHSWDGGMGGPGHGGAKWDVPAISKLLMSKKGGRGPYAGRTSIVRYGRTAAVQVGRASLSLPDYPRSPTVSTLL